VALWTPAKALIVVRTYPAPATKGVEVSCTAAITEDGRWLRLFPVPYRFLDADKRFRKYQWIEARIAKATDARPESHNIDIDSIRILGEPLPSEAAWRARKAMVYPLKAPSMCWLRAERDKHQAPTLGFFKPKQIKRLIIEPDSRTWTAAELARLRQFNLFGNTPTKELEKLPYKFKYEFTCDAPDCPGHEMMCADWEMGQAYRNFYRQNGTAWEPKFRLRFETEMIEKYDTHFFVGTVHQHPNNWIIVGLFYPPATPNAPAEQLPLL